MKVDDLNNSQLILMVLLITLVVSAAVSIATLSVVYDRVGAAGTVEAARPAVIQQTINRIIEREKVPPSSVEPVAGEPGAEPVEERITLDDIKESFTPIFSGSRQVTVGVFITPDGDILAARHMQKQRKYSVAKGGATLFAVIRNDKNYSILRPVGEGYRPPRHVPINVAAAEVVIGQPVLIFGGFDEEAGLHSEIISRKKGDDGGTIRTSADPAEITAPSAVFVNNRVVGFASDYSGWIPLATEELREGGEESAGTGGEAGESVESANNV